LAKIADSFTQIPGLTCSGRITGNTEVTRFPQNWLSGKVLRLDPSSARKHELVPIGILENPHRSPLFLPRLSRQLHALRLHQLCRGENVVAPERHRLKSANAVLMPLRREQRNVRIRSRNEQLNPPLALSELLIGRNFEPHLLRVELQRNILIADRDADNLYAANHRETSIPDFHPNIARNSCQRNQVVVAILLIGIATPSLQ